MPPRLNLATTGAPEAAFALLAADGVTYASATPGTLGGNRRSRIYGHLDCPTAVRAIARGGSVDHRVFFADEQTAVATGYRPCARCLPNAYARWKATHVASPGAQTAPKRTPSISSVGS